MKLDAETEARVRMGDNVTCPDGCGTMLRVWATHTGLTERHINCSSLACATRRTVAAFRGATVTLREATAAFRKFSKAMSR